MSQRMRQPNIDAGKRVSGAVPAKANNTKAQAQKEREPSVT